MLQGGVWTCANNHSKCNYQLLFIYGTYISISIVISFHVVTPYTFLVTINHPSSPLQLKHSQSRSPVS